jgi:uncharacterized protein (TIGR03382 family)
MTTEPSSVLLRSCLVAIATLALAPRAADAWAIGSQINETGCHEPITAEALRIARGTVATAPYMTPTRDEFALIDDVLFAPPIDFVGDIAGMTLLLGVRDNDLKGIDPLSSLDLIQVHGNPTTQEEHCIRGPVDDGVGGDEAALDACRTFIRDTATAALDGLDATGMVDANIRIPFKVYVALAGQVTPSLPLFYVKMGAAMHALEDGFAHTYRTDDGMAVTVVLNWIDLVDNGPAYDEARDGPPHRAELDHCWRPDAILARNYALATRAASELLITALDPTLTRDQKVLQFDVVTARYLSYQPGCTFANHWCDAPEANVANSNPVGCNAGGGGTLVSVVLVVLAVWWLARRNRRGAGSVLAVLVVASFATNARADTPIAARDPIPAPTPPAAASAPVAAVEPAAVEPVAPVTTEPKRDMKTITAAEVTSVRKDKQLGNPVGFAFSAGASIDRGAAAGTIGMRYRLNERWIVGADVGWNPWITTSPIKERSGVAMAYATLIRRFPMRFDRVNLRTSLHLGVSTLLFDVYGAPMYSTGPYIAICPLGIDYDLGGAVRLVIDPVEFALPVPLLGQLPLYYEQVRFMVGLQFGS